MNLKDKEQLQLILTNPSQCKTGYILAHKDDIKKSHDVFAIDVIKTKDVKEAVLKYLDYVNDLDNLGKIISISDYRKKWGYGTYVDKFKEIFGDFEE